MLEKAIDPAGRVAELWRFPVKSMRGEQIELAEVDASGIAGDRAYAVVDRQTGKIASAKHPRLWPDLLGCRATYVDEPGLGVAPPPARIELADGTMTRTDAPDVDAVLSRFFGREVGLTTAAPTDFTIDEYRPDVENLNPEGDRDVLVQQRLGSAFFEEAGLPSIVPPGSLMDLFPLSILTTSSLAEFRRLAPDSDWDRRRFRMNLIVDGAADGFAENEWLSKMVGIGPEVELLTAVATPRCVMTGLAQEELSRDSQILKAVATHNRRDIVGRGLYPCAGAYAVAMAPGTVRVGDDVRIGSDVDLAALGFSS